MLVLVALNTSVSVRSEGRNESRLPPPGTRPKRRRCLTQARSAG